MTGAISLVGIIRGCSRCNLLISGTYRLRLPSLAYQLPRVTIATIYPATVLETLSPIGYCLQSAYETSSESLYCLTVVGYQIAEQSNSLKARLDGEDSTPWHPDRGHFEIAVVSALRIESDAVEAVFDEIYYRICNKVDNDYNSYTTGKIGNHYIVLAYPPGIGKVISASTAANIRFAFQRIKLCLVVGICGGVPTINKSDGSTEILLGDVIISTEVIQYDRGKQLENRVVMKKTLQESLPLPNMEIQSFEAKMQGLTGRKRLRDSATENLIMLLKKEGLEAYEYPGADKDRLYEPTYRHKHHDPTACNICAKDDDVCGTALELPCDKLGCDTNKQVPRQRLKKPKESSSNGSVSTIEESAEVPEHRIYFGKFASGDLVLKSAHHRDDLASEDGVIAFEMEGAGVWINLPRVGVKCVCDHADSHKGHAWQKYAGAGAAACMRTFVTAW